MLRIIDEPGQLTLATAPDGARVTVLSVRAAPELARRLGALGLRPGTQVEVLHRVSGGGRIVSVAGARLALDRTILHAIEAEEMAE